MTSWSLSEMEAAKRSSQFVFVTETNNSMSNMTQATKMWVSSPEVIYQTGYRIAGSPQDIAAELQSLGIFKADIDNLVATAVNNTNYQTSMAALYHQEILAYKNFRKAVNKSGLESQGTTLETLVKTFNPELMLEKKKGKAKGHVDLAERIVELKSGHVLDVSKLEPNGTGARSIPPPSVRSKKYGSPNLPIVSSDFEHYLMAIRMLPNGEEKYYDAINYVYRIFYPTLGDWQPVANVRTVTTQVGQPDMGRMAPLTFAAAETAPTPMYRKKPKEGVITIAQVAQEADLFDFTQGTVASDYTLLSSFYSGLELMLRTYALQNYRSLLSPEDNIKLNSEFNMIVQQHNKQYLDTLLNVVDVEDMLEAWYRHFNPEKIAEITLFLEKYSTCEDVLFNRLYKKYVDPQAIYTKLWFADCQRPGIERIVPNEEDPEAEAEEQEDEEEYEEDD